MFEKFPGSKLFWCTNHLTYIFLDWFWDDNLVCNISVVASFVVSGTTSLKPEAFVWGDTSKGSPLSAKSFPTSCHMESLSKATREERCDVLQTNPCVSGLKTNGSLTWHGQPTAGLLPFCGSMLKQKNPKNRYSLVWMRWPGYCTPGYSLESLGLKST